MLDSARFLDEPLIDLSKNEWLTKLKLLVGQSGIFQSIGTKHHATLIDKSATLLVTFETIQGIQALDDRAHPLGWRLIKSRGWSHLALISDGDTWFRDSAVYDYFDRLTDDGFFDEFDRVLFYGAGPCGYAAAAFSVTAPGATVLAVQPQATLNPAIAGWDERFFDERRRDFTTRYGYAPDMLEAAQDAYIIFDPKVTLDAMHAALFTAPHVAKLPVPFMGATIQTQLMDMKLLHRLIEEAGTGMLSRQSFAKAMRARRDHPPYLRNLLSTLDAQDRTGLVRLLCGNVTARMSAPKFERRLQELDPMIKNAAE